MKNTTEWLANYFETTERYINEMMRDEKATSFLLIWPIFEQTVFGGFCQSKKLKLYAGKLEPYIDELDIDSMMLHFHNRYQNKNHYHHLCHQDKNVAISNMLKSSVTQLSDEDKIYFLLYVVYRYRNNIFHGNKGIKSWSHYTKEINYCMGFMMNVIDCYKTNIDSQE